MTLDCNYYCRMTMYENVMTIGDNAMSAKNVGNKTYHDGML